MALPDKGKNPSSNENLAFIGKTIKQNWFKEIQERDILLDHENLIAAIRGTIESGVVPLSGDRSTFANIGLTGTAATHVRDGLIGLTNKRVIFYMPKVFNRYEFESYDLDQISSIQFTKGMMKGRIQITAFNDHKTIKWINNMEGKKITEMIQKAVHALKFADKNTENNNLLSDKNPLDILKLRFAKGEISKEEFDEMKSTLE